MRYNSAVATIQIREIPEDSYEVLRRRARQAGQSIQAYMRAQVIDLASRPTKAEALARVETLLEPIDPDQLGTGGLLEDLEADRR